MANHHELPVSAGDAHSLAAITMNSLVTYVEEPGGEPRSVTAARSLKVRILSSERGSS